MRDVEFYKGRPSCVRICTWSVGAEVSLPAALPWFTRSPSARFTSSDHRDRNWMILPQDDADRWWGENTKSGHLQLDPDEVEVYRPLGENPPWLWEHERFSAWIEGQP